MIEKINWCPRCKRHISDNAVKNHPHDTYSTTVSWGIGKHKGTADFWFVTYEGWGDSSDFAYLDLEAFDSPEEVIGWMFDEDGNPSRRETVSGDDLFEGHVKFHDERIMVYKLEEQATFEYVPSPKWRRV